MIPSGRGAAMQRFLAAMEEEKQSSEERPGATSEPLPVRPVGRGRAMVFPVNEIEEGIQNIDIARPTGRGRGLQTEPQPPRMRGQMSVSEETSQPIVGVSRDLPAEVARPVGRGRSALMVAFLSQQSSESVPGKLQLPPPQAKSKPSSSPQKRISSTPVDPFEAPRESYSSRQVSSRGQPPERTRIRSSEESYSAEPIVQKGTSGQRQDIVCNYIRLDVAPGKGMFEYDLEFSPSEDSLSMRTRMLNQHLEEFGGVKSYNGIRLLLSIELNHVTTFSCVHPETERPVTLKLIYKGRAKGSDSADIYNMLFRRIMTHLGLKNMGRKFFDPSGAVTIPQHRLEVWPGYVTAVQQYEGGVQLCCDASHRVMRTESVLDVMSNIVRTNSPRFREEVLKLILGAVVLTRYNNRVYKIDDVSWDKTPSSTFTDSNGREMTFYEYYRNNYEINIQDKNQPLLISRVDRRKQSSRRGGAQEEEVRMICLIPELCFITGLTEAMRADFRIMKDLTLKLQLSPTQRYEGLCKFLQNIGNNKPSQELLMKWGLRVAQLPVRLEARIVPRETIVFRDGQMELAPGASKWVVNNALLVPKDIRYWSILHVSQDLRVAQEFESSMRKACSQMGMKVYPGKLVKVTDNRNENFLDALRSTIVPDLQLVVIFFPSLRADRYAAVKKVCCVERPVSSQVIQSRTLSRPEKARSIINKIAMQINCKLGGALWGLNIPYDKLMVCGLDVYHCPGGKSVSVMGFVATSDPQQISWYSRVGFGENQQELVDNLRICMGGALKKYREVSGFYPDRIILYRDGVGDGQLNMSKEFEIPQLLQSFNDLNKSYKPKFTFVVCQKRILTRIMTVQGGSGSNIRLQNPLPGSVLDHTVTRYEWYDFFLVSQSSNRGTVSPTHYIVLYDDGEIKPDHIQRMTYKMTHLYYNWTGTISIPAPAQYAHRLAQLVGQHLHKDPSATMNDKLFFL